MEFPPIMSNCEKHFEKYVISFVVEFWIIPRPSPEFKERVLYDRVAGILTLFATTSLYAGSATSVCGEAQYVPPLPSDVRIVRAGINVLFGLYANTLRIVRTSVLYVLLDIL